MNPSDFDPFAQLMGQELLGRAVDRLNEKLAARGLTALDQTSVDVQEQFVREAITETAFLVPGADLAMLNSILDGVFRSELRDALQAILPGLSAPFEALDFASGVDAALIMAFFGLPVAPMERGSGQITSPLSVDLGQVAADFDAIDADLVGYSTCEAPFYVLFTDCHDTVARLLRSEVKLDRIRTLFERDDLPLPEDRGTPFVHACWIFRRQRGDRVGGFMYMDPRTDWGSFFLFAGFMEDCQPKGGGEHGGLKPVPRQLLKALLQAPDAHSFVRGQTKPTPSTAH